MFISTYLEVTKIKKERIESVDKLLSFEKTLNHLRNEYIRDMGNIKKDINEKIDQLWYGIVMRMNGHRWRKRMLEYHPVNHRKRR